MAQHADKQRKDAAPAAKEPAWRTLLRDHAGQRWRDAVDCLSKGERIAARDDAALVPLISSLGTQGEEAIQIVDRFALGSATEAFASGKADGQPDEEFASQLETILDGFGQVSAAAVRQRMEKAEQEAALHRPQLFQSELWQLLYKVRESAELSYKREIDLAELDRRILLLLRAHGPLVPAAISAAAGVDKAQVSRSVKRLLELGLIERDQIRSPVILTAAGQALTGRLMRLAELRNRELGFDISDRELTDFFSVIESILDRAVGLYEQERELARKSGRRENEHEPAYEFEERRSGEPIPLDRSRIAPLLLTLSAYLSRSGALALKRQIGLSNFESWVLAEISYDPPTDWPRLVKALERDHSQAGRTVNALIERGLVVREGKPARRHGRFTPTGEGLKLYDVIVKSSHERAAFLMDELPAEKLAVFTTVFDKLARNAAAQLQRERAYEELESS